jgi:hypothetical protein
MPTGALGAQQTKHEHQFNQNRHGRTLHQKSTFYLAQAQLAA